jgi:two-component system copper resistance phosphate regulon response regulator CusR
VIARDHAPRCRPDSSGRDEWLVLVAEHEAEVAEMTRRYLERSGVPGRVTASPEETVALLRSRLAAAYVLDLTMPGLDIRLVRRALASGPPAAMVFLMDPRGIRPRGLSAGPGPRRWLARPFSPRALVDAVGETLADPGRWCQRPALSRPMAPTTGMALTAGEDAVLRALVLAGGRVLSREELVAAVATGRRNPVRAKAPGPRTIDVYVTQLRAKLGAEAIRTVRGSGYALTRLRHERW